jgi:hypothetical protein
MESDPERHLIFKRLDWLDRENEETARAMSEWRRIQARESLRRHNLERAFAAVSFLFAVHLLIDLFRCF